MDTVSITAIQQLKALYPTTTASLRLHPVLDHPWYLVAIVAFNAAHQPEAVVSVYKATLEDLRAHGNNVVDVDVDLHVTLVKRIQEALLKASLINGITRTAATILLLKSFVPEPILERLSSSSRDFTKPLSDLAPRGRQFLNEMYGDADSAKAQGFLDSYFPDFGMFTAATWGLVLGHSSVLSPLETSYILIAASVLNDFPKEVCWNYLGAMRSGATIDETKAIREMALKVASLSNVTLREKVPEVVAEELIQVSSS